jgi:hypothetical protein
VVHRTFSNDFSVKFSRVLSLQFRNPVSKFAAAKKKKKDEVAGNMREQVLAYEHDSSADMDVIRFTIS